MTLPKLVHLPRSTLCSDRNSYTFLPWHILYSIKTKQDNSQYVIRNKEKQCKYDHSLSLIQMQFISRTQHENGVPYVGCPTSWQLG